jgi:alpha-glucan phosphorylase-like protein
MKPIAFFCAEYGIEESLPLYAGGLGILSGDFLREAGDEHVPLVALGLFYSGGFEAAHVSHADQDSHVLSEHGFQPVLNAEGKPLLLTVDTETDSNSFFVQAWTRTYGSTRLYLLDTNVEQNAPELREVTRHLYDSNFNNQMRQEFILGVAGVKLLRALNINPGVYHLNEGHTSFVALALAAEYLHDNPQETSFIAAMNAVRPHIVASKHTILSGAGLYIEKETLRKVIGHYIVRHRIDFDELFSVGVSDNEPNLFSATKFLLQAAIRSNGVSMLHTIFERQKHPRSPLIPITNGVYPPKWRSELWPKEGTGIMTDDELWKIRTTLRSEMIEYIEKVTGAKLDPKALTIVWARRFASYKRPGLLFSDLKRLEQIVSDPKQPIQFVISGNTHEADPAGVEMIQTIRNFVSRPPFLGKIVYVPHYSMHVAKILVQGADVWLNTPLRGVEASGTSGMKAGLNGGLQCSISDGWIEEVDWTDMGWILAEQHTEISMYDTIEHQIKPLFYDRSREDIPEHWVKRIRKTIDVVSHRYTTKRMLHEYIAKLYYPEAETHQL